eukprot:11196366-Lingulodinium_polyedra.AAC.1
MPGPHVKNHCWLNRVPPSLQPGLTHEMSFDVGNTRARSFPKDPPLRWCSTSSLQSAAASAVAR